MKKYIINHPSQLNSLSTLPLKKNSGIGRISLSGSFENNKKKDKYENRLNKYYHACGCDTGAKGLLLGFTIIILYSIYQFSTIGNLSSNIYISLCIGILISSIIIGKLYGLYKANQKLKNTIKSIQKDWKIPEGSNVNEDYRCG